LIFFSKKNLKKNTGGFEKWTFLKCPFLKRWGEVSAKKFILLGNALKPKKIIQKVLA